ncbi:MAG: hydrogenase iron-sulfur subunit [Desulfitobacteriaceae bacterium]|nr:hydrogenase iron-sulfur subunit [Desulfitobacteriaceae bacterium]MDI6914295.1 hydrogenase iron-sulfur subunit [Desulfitobacteriaceae bacterium]
MPDVLETVSEQWEPLIVGFACRHCRDDRPAGAAKVRLITLPCLGRANPQLVVRALQKGADGLFLAGGECRGCPWAQGISSTLNRLVLMRRLLEFLGLETERFQVWLVGAGLNQGQTESLAGRINAMEKTVRALGPNKKLRDE